MGLDSRYYLATVADNDDELLQGRLKLVIGGISGTDEVFPEWILPRLVGASNGAVALFWIPPVGSVVYVEANRTTEELRWLGSELGVKQGLADLLADNYPRRVGFTSNGAGLELEDVPDAVHGLVLDQDDGLLVHVVKGDQTHTLELTTAGEFKVATKGETLELSSSLFESVLAAAKLVRWNGTKGILVHSGGVEAKASTVAVVFPVVKNTINTPLSNALTELKAALNALGLPTVNTDALITALGAGTYDTVTLKSD